MTNQKGNKSLAVIKQEMFDVVQSSVHKAVDGGALHLPANYSPGNALKSAWLMLQEIQTRDKKPVLQECSPQSIQNALYNMVVQGLNPEKKQGYFIAYGNKLLWQRSYFGNAALAKRVTGGLVDDIVAEVVYQDDQLEYDIVRGQKVVTGHKQQFGNIDKDKIIGAYAQALDADGNVLKTELMTISQIHQSWGQSSSKPFDDKGNLKSYSTHAKFTEDMAKRTVVNKVCKFFINSSDDSTLVGQSIRHTTDEMSDARIAEDYAESANQQVIDIEPQDGQHPEGVDPDTGEVFPEQAGEQQVDDKPPFM